MVPRDASVSTHDEWYTAISARNPRAEVLGTPFIGGGADYIVFAEDFPNATFHDVLLPKLREALACGDYRLVVRRGAVAAFKRGPHPRGCL
jgi:hypothetical protein